MQELHLQVVTEKLSTLYLTRLIGFPAISTDPPHAFILCIQEKHGEAVTHGLKFLNKYGKRDRFKRFLQEIAMRKKSIRQGQPTCRNQTHRKLESIHKLLTAQTALPVREIVLDGALLTYFPLFFC